MNHKDALLLVVMLILNNSISPEELEELAHQLAEFDAVNDALTDWMTGVAI
jgi:hypothetical protein